MITDSEDGGLDPSVWGVAPRGRPVSDIALFGDQPRSASALAVEPTVLLALSPEHFRRMVLEDPAMSFEVFRALSARIRRFDEAIQVVGR